MITYLNLSLSRASKLALNLELSWKNKVMFSVDIHLYMVLAVLFGLAMYFTKDMLSVLYWTVGAPGPSYFNKGLM